MGYPIGTVSNIKVEKRALAFEELKESYRALCSGDLKALTASGNLLAEELLQERKRDKEIINELLKRR